MEQSKIRPEKAEKIRKIVDKYFLYRHPGGKILAFPSGKGGVGKTIVTLNLGAALAKKGVKVAVVDVNFALPNIHSYLGVLPGKTITHYLSGFCNLEDLTAVKVDVGEKMDIYPARSIVNLSKPPELDKLITLFIQMKNKYDYILLDMPPGMSKYSVYPATLSDFAIIIANDEKASYLDATEVKKKLEDFGVCFFGIIVNKCKGKPKYFKENVIGTIPTDESLKNFPKVWKRRFLISKGVRSIMNIAENILDTQM